jgi:hypothetical protein
VHQWPKHALLICGLLVQQQQQQQQQPPALVKTMNHRLCRRKKSPPPSKTPQAKLKKLSGLARMMLMLTQT